MFLNNTRVLSDMPTNEHVYSKYQENKVISVGNLVFELYGGRLSFFFLFVIAAVHDRSGRATMRVTNAN